MPPFLRTALILYCLALLAVITTYIAWSDTTVGLRMNVATTGIVDLTKPNLFSVWVFEKNKDYNFSGWTLQTTLYGLNNEVVARSMVPVQKDGTAIITLQLAQTDRTITFAEFAQSLDLNGDIEEQLRLRSTPHALFELHAPDKTLKKRATILLSTAHEYDIIPKLNDISVAETGASITQNPATILFNVDMTNIGQYNNQNNINEQNNHHSEYHPEYDHYIYTKVLYGKADIPEKIPVSPLGFARIQANFSFLTDVEFSYGNYKTYGTFLPNEHPVRLDIPEPVITPNDGVTVYPRTLSDNGRMTFNLYDGNSWVGHTEKGIDGHLPVNIIIPGYSIDKTRVIYLTACLFRWSCNDQAHQSALIAAPGKMSLRDQTLFALNQLTEAEFERQRDRERMTQLFDRVRNDDHIGDQELVLARDYALTVLTQAHQRVEPVVAVRTEIEDKERLLRNKERHRSIANPILLFMLGAGLFAIVLAFARARVYVSTIPDFDADPSEPEVLDSALSPLIPPEPRGESHGERLRRILLYIILTLVMAGTFAALFFMMQLI